MYVCMYVYTHAYTADSHSMLSHAPQGRAPTSSSSSWRDSDTNTHSRTFPSDPFTTQNSSTREPHSFGYGDSSQGWHLRHTNSHISQLHSSGLGSRDNYSVDGASSSSRNKDAARRSLEGSFEAVAHAGSITATLMEFIQDLESRGRH